MILSRYRASAGSTDNVSQFAPKQFYHFVSGNYALGWMSLVSLDCASIGIYSREFDVFTKIVATFHTKEACLARNSRLDCYTITCGPSQQGL
jgi:hypothetical protein